MSRRHTKQGRHPGPTPQEYVVTQLPGALSTGPGAQFSGSAGNVLTDDGTYASADGGAGTSGDRAAFCSTFGFDSVLPSDAAITKVELIVQWKTDGVAANPRPGVSLKINSIPGSWRQAATADMSTSESEKVFDITADGSTAADFATWGITAWTRDVFLNTSFRMGIRSNNSPGGATGINYFDVIKTRLTYTGSPPGTPVTTTGTLNVGRTGTGTGNVTGPGIDTGSADSSESYPIGTQVPLQATATGGSFFEKWTLDATDYTQNPITVGIDGAVSIDAVFTGTPPGDPVETHLGAVIAEDLVVSTDLVGIFGNVTDPYSAGGVDFGGTPVNPNDTPWIVYVTGGASPYTAHAQASPPTHHRLFEESVAPIQSVYDAHTRAWPDPTASTRTQVEKWSTVSSFVRMHEGDRVFLLLDFKVVDPSVLPYNLATRSTGGSDTQTQIFQCKANLATGAFDLIFAVNSRTDGFQFRCSGTTGVRTQTNVSCDLTQWQRFGMEILWSADASVGYYRLWGKLDGVDSWVALSDVVRRALLYTTGGTACFGFGPYSHYIMSGPYKCRYNNIQVVRYA